MQLLTKFWKTKLLTLAATIAGTVGIWGSLAWDDWTAHRVTAEEELAGALLYLAATSAPTPAPPPVVPPAVQVRVIQPVEVRRVYVVTRHVQGAAGEPAAPPSAPPPAAALPTPEAAAPVTRRTTQTQPVQQPAPSAPPPAPAPAPAPKPAPPPVPSKGS